MNPTLRSPILAHSWLFALALSLIALAAHAAVAAEPIGPETEPGGSLVDPATHDTSLIADRVRTAQPPWLATPTQRDGDALLVNISAGPYSSPEECRQALSESVRAAAAKQIDDYLNEPGAADRMNLPDALLDELRVVEPDGNRREHLESMSLSVGAMFTLHSQLRFDRRFMDKIQTRWHEAVAGERLRLAGFATLGIVALIGLIHAAARFFAS